ncbi:acyl-CoA dehydrogenase [Citricoccus sp. SGAir0253]|uniref:acyl-CoA dehydrogenase family protein n=1 Tax=Citricoccus sp. SGAir0253 TaxID=2567881 RepID=UPI0010CD4B2D|nr:acyl-CoA dehydrogenase family protein [Citricoccus sp. SGAir0253]QCU79046.1 acyl-CoA dehydrogenase [Citricoccus sp. SGAir0253]
MTTAGNSTTTAPEAREADSGPTHRNGRTGSHYASLSARFAPAFAEVARGETAREAGRHLPFAPLEQLRAAGLGGLTVPESAGGAGAGQEDALRLLMDLAAVDANTAHLLRSHLSFVEHVLVQADAALRSRWLARVMAGELAGSALSESPGPALGELATTVWKDDGGSLRIRGRKYYTTGSIFATWTLATARLEEGVPRPGRRRGQPRTARPEAGRPDDPRLPDRTDLALAVVRVRQPRAAVKDDWDGFGQRLTGTGTVEFDGAGVEDLLVLPPADGHVPLHHEATLMALLAGVGRAALRDGIGLTRARRRSPNTAGGLTPREDDQLLGIVGELSAQQATAEELVRAAGRDLDEALAVAAQPAAAATAESATEPETGTHPEPGAEPAAETAAEAMRRAALTVHRAHVMVPRLVLDTCTRIFDTLGASATSTDLQLDRHWRNARTLASHDPAVFMARMVGDWEVNGTRPVPYLTTGTV